MKIVRLHVHHLRGIPDLTLTFAPATTVLVGKNGTGKSAILDCLARLLRRASEDPIDGHLGSLVVGTMQGRSSRPSPSMPAFFDASDISHGEAQVQSTLTVEVDGAQVSGSLAAARSQLHQILGDTGALREAYRRRATAEGASLFVYFGVRRAMHDAEPLDYGGPPLSPTMAFDRALTGGTSNFRFFFDWFKEREDLENERVRADASYRDPQLQAVRSAVESMLPGFSGLRIRRGAPHQLVIAKDGLELSLNELSDGEKGILALAGDLARRLALANPGAEAPCACAGVVLIDEIEQHLHPGWQRRIIPSLERTFPSCQFVVSTHSPQVLSELPPEAIRILHRDRGQVSVHVPRASYGLSSDRILEDLMESSARPEEIEETIAALYDEIARGDLDAARRRAAALRERMGGDTDPVLTRAEALIHRRELLGR